MKATFEELLDFCNKVREAGGGNPLDALMPAVPQVSDRCLVAKNLNFNCEVQVWAQWVMVSDEATAKRIAEALGLKLTEQTVKVGTIYRTEFGVELPEAIGEVAQAFDDWMDLVNDLYVAWEVDEDLNLDEVDRALLREFQPYVDAAVDEAIRLGELTDSGQLIL